jgi:hypothetical protein
VLAPDRVWLADAAPAVPVKDAAEQACQAVVD